MDAKTGRHRRHHPRSWAPAGCKSTPAAAVGRCDGDASVVVGACVRTGGRAGERARRAAAEVVKEEKRKGGTRLRNPSTPPGEPQALRQPGGWRPGPYHVTLLQPARLCLCSCHAIEQLASNMDHGSSNFYCDRVCYLDTNQYSKQGKSITPPGPGSVASSLHFQLSSWSPCYCHQIYRCHKVDPSGFSISTMDS